MLTARTMVFSDACSPLHRASECSGCGDTKIFLLSETNKPNRVHGTSPREEDDVHGGRDDGESATAETHLLTQLSMRCILNLCCSRQVAYQVINRMDHGWVSPAKSHRDGGLDDMFDGPRRDTLRWVDGSSTAQ